MWLFYVGDVAFEPQFNEGEEDEKHEHLAIPLVFYQFQCKFL